MFLFALVGPVCGADRSSEFLAKLRVRGWHDVALEYLNRAEDDPLASAEFLARVPFEIAVSRSDLARQTLSENERQRQFQQAAQEFRAFIDSHAGSPLVISALSRLSTLLADQALAEINKADRMPPGAAAEINRLHTAARSQLEEANRVLADLTEKIPAQLSALPQGTAGVGNEKVLARRRELEEQLAEARFLEANILFEKSRTYDQNSAEQDDALRTAVEQFTQLQKQYQNKLIGFYAQLYEGRCYQALGKYDEALKVLGGLTSRPVGQEVFRALIAKALRYRAECMIHEGMFEQAIEECGEWLTRSTAEEREQADWLAIAYRLGDAYAARAEKAEDDRQASRDRTEARRQYREVSRHAGEFQNDARAALAISGSDLPRGGEVKGFSQALEAGKQALEQVELSTTAAKLAERNNPDAVEDLQQQATESRAAAIRYFETALREADNKIPGEQLAEARYYLCWLFYKDGRTEEAAELGLSIADQNPQSPFARTAAKVALAGYEELYLKAQQQESAEAAQLELKLENVATLIRGRWPESNSSADALGVLMRIAIQENRFTEAEKLFAELPERARTRLGFSMGQSLWNRYLVARQAGDASQAQELKLLIERAEQLFAAGYAGVKDSAQLERAQSEGLLGYFQLLVTTGQAARALQVWNLPQVGLKIQVQNWQSQANRRQLALEAYKLALQANLSANPPQTDDALKLLGELEGIVGDRPQDRHLLTSIYVSLARQLEQESRQLQAQGQKAKAQKMSEAFAQLIERVAEGQDDQDWTTKAWLADMSLQLAAGLPPLEARRHVQHAARSYRAILDEAARDPESGPQGRELLAVRKKMGECLAAQGQYSAAMQQYTEILNQMPNLPDLQVAAAEALQAWGISKGDAALIDQAILGAQPNAAGNNLVWGWIKMSKFLDAARAKAERTTETNPQAQEIAARYEDLYYKARYNAAVARLATAKLASGAEREKQLRTVRQSILGLRQVHPDLGGPEWLAKFEQLLSEVEPAK